ncbi:histone acetyltransferase KAT2A-like isoform X2 [Metopolophium dirhodum]|nr:histone acetyltransferase KAT2A-like isoform X2 [Metopolophium dirhodum]
MISICDRSLCNHKLYDHVSHLVNAPEKMLNHLTMLVIDFENINDEIERLSKLPADGKTNPLLKRSRQYKGLIYHEIKYFRNLDSSIDVLADIPPFESPAIEDIFMHFCLYEYSHNTVELQMALNISRQILDHFNHWIWVTPEELPFLNKLKFSNSYKFYYQRYQKHCLTSFSNHSKIKPSYSSSIVFGQDILKYTLKVFRQSLTNWCINKSQNCTFSKKRLFMNKIPKFLDLLEQEVYEIDSPIWDPNFTNTPATKKILDRLNLKIHELTQNQFIAPRMTSNIPERINNNCSNGVTLKIPDVKHNDMCKNYGTTDTMLDTFEDIDVGANTSLKGFITNHKKRQTQAKDKQLGIEMIVFDSLSNITKCVLCRKELRNMYQTRLPRLPDIYIARLQTDEQIQTLAMLEEGIPIGGIYFRTFNSQGFSEIVLCMFKVDLHVNGYESRLMNYLKDLHIKQNIWDLLVYVDKEKFAFFKNHNFSTEVKISKKKYNKFIVHYEDSKLMHCNLKK